MGERPSINKVMAGGVEENVMRSLIVQRRYFDSAQRLRTGLVRNVPVHIWIAAFSAGSI